MSRGSSGFTLLEVLVALAIIALALGAVLQLATQSARTSTHLRDKTAALYVATNLSAEVELFGPPASGERRELPDVGPHLALGAIHRANGGADYSAGHNACI